MARAQSPHVYVLDVIPMVVATHAPSATKVFVVGGIALIASTSVALPFPRHVHVVVIFMTPIEMVLASPLAYPVMSISTPVPLAHPVSLYPWSRRQVFAVQSQTRRASRRVRIMI